MHAFAQLTVPEIEHGLLAVILLGIATVVFFVVFSLTRALVRAVWRSVRWLAQAARPKVNRALPAAVEHAR